MRFSSHTPVSFIPGATGILAGGRCQEHPPGQLTEFCQDLHQSPQTASHHLCVIFSCLFFSVRITEDYLYAPSFSLTGSRKARWQRRRGFLFLWITCFRFQFSKFLWKGRRKWAHVKYPIDWMLTSTSSGDEPLVNRSLPHLRVQITRKNWPCKTVHCL